MRGQRETLAERVFDLVAAAVTEPGDEAAEEVQGHAEKLASTRQVEPIEELGAARVQRSVARGEAPGFLSLACGPGSSGRFHSSAEALLCGLGRGAEDVVDRLPRHALAPGCGDCVEDLLFPPRSGDRRPFQDVFLKGSLVSRLWLVLQRTTGRHGSVEDDAIVGASEVLVVNGIHVVAGVAK